MNCAGKSAIITRVLVAIRRPLHCVNVIANCNWQRTGTKNKEHLRKPREKTPNENKTDKRCDNKKKLNRATNTHSE